MRHAREDYSNIQEITAGGNKPRIPDDEPVFLIRAQDMVGPDAVRAWADLAEAAGAHQDIVALAYEQALDMENWQGENGKKVPDLA